MAIVTFNSTTINNVLIHKNQLSATDLAKLNANPNLMGKLALETLGATKTIPELDMVMDAGASADSYYMCSEKSGAYLVDSRVAYGTNIITSSWYVGGTSLDTTIVGETIVFNSIGDAYYYNGSFAPSVGTIQLIELEVSNYVSGAIFVDAGNQLITPSINANGTYAYLIKAIAGTTLNRPIVRSFNSAGFVGDVSGLSIREATATEIANYPIDDSVRLNADLQQKGIQTTAFVTDGAGVPTAYSSNLLQFNGDGRYVDTKWIPDITKDFTVEVIYEHIANSTFKRNGTNLTYFGANSDNTFSFAVGGVVSSTSLHVVGFNHLVFVYSASTSKFKTYVNGVFDKESTLVSTADTVSFYIGDRNNATSYPQNGDVATTIRTTSMTATEVATAYAKAKTIYPSLP